MLWNFIRKRGNKFIAEIEFKEISSGVDDSLYIAINQIFRNQEFFCKYV